MVQVDISQLSGECNTWRESLRQQREEFTRDKEILQQTASRTLSKEELKDVEHFHNQFHIQLINIHDLKQAIKIHDRKLQFERTTTQDHLNEDTVASHEGLFDQYQTLEHTLQDLRDEFNQFLSRTR